MVLETALSLAPGHNGLPLLFSLFVVDAHSNCCRTWTSDHQLLMFGGDGACLLSFVLVVCHFHSVGFAVCSGIPIGIQQPQTLIDGDVADEW